MERGSTFAAEDFGLGGGVEAGTEVAIRLLGSMVWAIKRARYGVVGFRTYLDLVRLGFTL